MGKSIYGESFPITKCLDGKLKSKQNTQRYLSMLSRKNKVGSSFDIGSTGFIIGRVTEGFNVLEKISKYGPAQNCGYPSRKIEISNCGVLSPKLVTLADFDEYGPVIKVTPKIYQEKNAAQFESRVRKRKTMILSTSILSPEEEANEVVKQIMETQEVIKVILSELVSKIAC